jgi:excisionase family DNA binding protein
MDDYLNDQYGPLMTLEELAIVLKMPDKTLRKKITSKELDISHIQIGKRYLFNTAKVAFYCDRAATGDGYGSMSSELLDDYEQGKAYPLLHRIK